MISNINEKPIANREKRTVICKCETLLPNI